MGASSGCVLMTGLSEVCCAVIASQRVAQTRGRYSFVVPAKAGTHTPCPIISGADAETFCSNERRWLWVPAFAGTTLEDCQTTDTTSRPAARCAAIAWLKGYSRIHGE